MTSSLAHLDDPASARSLLFVPGDRPERFEKAAASGADLIILDLEDAVAAEDKSTALQNVVRWLAAGRPAVVRINAVGTPTHEDEITELAPFAPALMVPKVASAEQLTRFIGDAWRGAGPVIPLLETASGIYGAREIAGVAGVARLALGTIDLAAELGVDPYHAPAMAFARSALVFGSAAAGLSAPIDGVTVAIKDLERLQVDLEIATSMGLGARMCLHPDQVAATNLAFSPSSAEVTWAQRVQEVASSNGGGVTVLDGEMIDAPVVARAERILARASGAR